MTTYPHRIRLRRPWECHAQETTVRCRRGFGYPGRIDAHERVWLTIDPGAARASVVLNEIPLGEIRGSAEFEVTGLLQPRNVLVLEVERTAGQDEPWGEVALEVRCTAYLRNVRAWTDGLTLHAAGEVAGFAEEPLDLYLILDRSPLAETRVTAGQPFVLSANAAAGPGQIVQVDLVNGAVVWYTMRQLLRCEAK
jgi:hypothetical protein